MDIQSILNKENSKIHFIGIGGVSMSSLAHLLKSDGHIVTGSDANENSNTAMLRSLGVAVVHGHSAANINGQDLVVYTAAISEDNEELKAALSSGIPTIERSVLLGEIMKKYRFPVNIAGTHGKTTTTSMLSEVFLTAGLEPTISVGGDFDRIKGNLYIGGKDYFICEACEYVESFLKFYPYASVILNIDADHLDYFTGIEHIKRAFTEFAERTDENGFVVINGDDSNCRDIIKNIDRTVYTFGLSEKNSVFAKNIVYNNQGAASYDLYYKNQNVGRIELSVGGEHNVLNSLAVSLCSLLFGIDINDIKSGLKSFGGVHRRFEYKGTVNGFSVYDDYAHHPTEIKATLNTLKNRASGHSYVIFQPHTYTRTKALLNEFAEVLTNADRLIITDIYAAREKNIYGISSKDLADKIDGAVYISSFEDVEKYILDNARSGDTVITVGAGNVFEIGEHLITEHV